MGKSAHEIYMDYSRALKQADTLDDIAARIRKVANGGISGCIDQTAASWKGNEASQYIRKEQRLAENVLRSADQAERIAGSIRRIAGNTYNAEMRALQLAEKRSYRK